MRIAAFRSDRARAAYCDLYDSVLAASPIPVTQSDVETSFGRAHVVTAGDPAKPPLVAFHGMAFSATSWLPQLPVLAANHSVTLIDAIGDVNKSVATKPIRAAGDVVAWIDEVFRTLGIERAAVVGLSMGAWMAANYAMAFSNRIERLALIAPVGLVIGQHPSWLVRASYTNLLRPTKAGLQTFVESTVTPRARHMLREDPWRLIIEQYIEGVMRFAIPIAAVRPTVCDLSRLASAEFPVLVVEGRDESLHDGAKAAARYRKQLPNARVEVIGDANHVIPVDQPTILDRLLADFLT